MNHFQKQIFFKKRLKFSGKKFAMTKYFIFTSFTLLPLFQKKLTSFANYLANNLQAGACFVILIRQIPPEPVHHPHHGH